MADDSKTEKATPKKRRDERKEGNVFSSKDIIAVASLLGTFYSLKFLFSGIYENVYRNLIWCVQGVSAINELSMEQLREIGISVMEICAVTILPLGFIASAIGIVATGVQTRFNFTAKAASFKMSNLSILKGVKNLFSLRNVVELIKNILKIIILSIILYKAIESDIIPIARMLDMDIKASAVFTFDMIMNIILKVGLVFVVIAGFDYMYQRWEYEKKLKMSKQELKEEYKQTEGNPEIKGKIRNLQRSMARNRMMQAVPDADVIIKNPTHFAVALKYDIDHHNAPIVIAKGQDYLALRIIEIGEQNQVTVIENKPLARGIYASTPLDCEIPAEYYGVVAEILVQVFRLNKKME